MRSFLNIRGVFSPCEVTAWHSSWLSANFRPPFAGGTLGHLSPDHDGDDHHDEDKVDDHDEDEDNDQV